MTTSCCPAFVNMIKQHFPMLLENMSTTVSPMCAVSRMIRVGSGYSHCIHRPLHSQEEREPGFECKGNVDYAKTFGEIRVKMRAKGRASAVENDYQESLWFGKRFGNRGKCTAAVLECPAENGRTQMSK